MRTSYTLNLDAIFRTVFPWNNKMSKDIKYQIRGLVDELSKSFLLGRLVNNNPFNLIGERIAISCFSLSPSKFKKLLLS